MTHSMILRFAIILVFSLTSHSLAENTDHTNKSPFRINAHPMSLFIGNVVLGLEIPLIEQFSSTVELATGNAVGVTFFDSAYTSDENAWSRFYGFNLGARYYFKANQGNYGAYAALYSSMVLTQKHAIAPVSWFDEQDSLIITAVSQYASAGGGLGYIWNARPKKSNPFELTIGAELSYHYRLYTKFAELPTRSNTVDEVINLALGSLFSITNTVYLPYQSMCASLWLGLSF